MLALAGCGGGSNGVAPSVPKLTTPQAQQVTFVINVPKTTSAPSAVHPHYISPSTQSATLVIKQGATTVLSQTANLTVSSAGCTSTLTSTQCVLTVSLAPGSYTATMSTFDQTGGAGNLLSSGQNVPFTVVAGANNQIGLSLSGVPASYAVTPQNNVTTGSKTLGFTIAGMQAQSFMVSALDADGNYIVGAGAPTYSLAETSGGGGWAVTNPTAALPNNFTITPANTQNSTATLQITANFADTTCSLAGAVCTATFGVKNDLPTLFVAACTSGCGATGDAVLIYAPPYTGSPITISASGPTQIALDGSQNLYIINALAASPNVSAYAPPYTGAAYASFSAASSFGLQVTPAGLIVLTRAGGSSGILGFGSIYNSSTGFVRSTYLFSGAFSSIDASGNIWFQNSGLQIAEYTPPSYGQLNDTNIPATTIEAFVVNASTQTAYVAGSSLVAVGPVGSTLPSVALPGGTIAYGITYDPSGNAIAATTSGVMIFTPALSLTTTITSGVNIGAGVEGLPVPQAVAVDNGYDIFVANNGAQTVTMYEPPYTSTAVTIPTGFTPFGVMLGP